MAASHGSPFGGKRHPPDDTDRPRAPSSTSGPDTASDNQWWRLVPATSGYHRLKNVRNGWCADVQDASTDGARVIQWPDNGGANQERQILAL